LVAVKAHKDMRVEIGENVAIRVPTAICHLFDAATGERLGAQG
jgi:multiple sugar transport system ATP-binding protein